MPSSGGEIRHMGQPVILYLKRAATGEYLPKCVKIVDHKIEVSHGFHKFGRTIGFFCGRGGKQSFSYAVKVIRKITDLKGKILYQMQYSKDPFGEEDDYES